MNVIQDSAFRRTWQNLGEQFGRRWSKPRLILCISAHWLTQGWWLTGMAQPKTIHDFGGFPQELFEQQYPAPGAPEWAAQASQRFHQPSNGSPLGLDLHDWGLDHGCWGVLKPMFPQADTPVVQLSIDYHRPPEEHFDLGAQLKPLRNEGVLIVASGNTVHNLRAVHRHAADGQAYEWGQRFDAWVDTQVRTGQREALTRFRELGEDAQLAHPTWDHYLPLLYAAGAADDADPLEVFNENHQLASIAMRSFIWG